MRALDITVFLIAIQASIGFIDATGAFDNTYYATPSNEYADYNISQLGGATTKNDIISKGVSTAEMAVDFLWNALFFIVTVLSALILIYPTLVTTFYIPASISAMLQVLIYFMYFLGYTEWKSGKSAGAFT